MSPSAENLHTSDFLLYRTEALFSRGLLVSNVRKEKKPQQTPDEREKTAMRFSMSVARYVEHFKHNYPLIVQHSTIHDYAIIINTSLYSYLKWRMKRGKSKSV